MMNFKSVVEAAKIAQKELKALLNGQATDSRILVQFQNTEVYQYRCNAEGLAKLTKVNFDEVIMVQFAVGTVAKRGRFNKFTPMAVKMLAYKEVFQVPSKDEVAVEDGDFAW